MNKFKTIISQSDFVIRSVRRMAAIFGISSKLKWLSGRDHSRIYGPGPEFRKINLNLSLTQIAPAIVASFRAVGHY